MKLPSALILTALLGASSAFAATPPSSSGDAPAAIHASKHTSSKACNKQADGRKLTGDARTSFVKDCRAGKTDLK